MTGNIRAVTGRQLVKVLERIGFIVRRQKGSHVHMFRASDGRRTTVPVHGGRDIPIGTLRAILKAADLSPDQIRDLI